MDWNEMSSSSNRRETSAVWEQVLWTFITATDKVVSCTIQWWITWIVVAYINSGCLLSVLSFNRMMLIIFKPTWMGISTTRRWTAPCGTWQCGSMERIQPVASLPLWVNRLLDLVRSYFMMSFETLVIVARQRPGSGMRVLSMEWHFLEGANS